MDPIPLPMRPQGVKGKAFGFLMERLNKGSYKKAIKLAKIRNGAAVLDIGFGTGALLDLIAARFRDVTLYGVDPTPTMVSTAKRKSNLRKLGTRLDLRCGDVTSVDWPGNSFDAIIAVNSFQFWDDPQTALRRLPFLLKNGGRLVFVLRDHSRRAPDWLPNPLSRSGNEAAALRSLLNDQAALHEVGPKRGLAIAYERRAPQRQRPTHSMPRGVAQP